MVRKTLFYHGGVNNLAKLRERQEKLERVVELQKTIEAYESKTHIPEALEGAAVGAIAGIGVGVIVAGEKGRKSRRCSWKCWYGNRSL